MKTELSRSKNVDATPYRLQWWRELSESEAQRLWGGDLPSRWRVRVACGIPLIDRAQLIEFAKYCREIVKPLSEGGSDIVNLILRRITELIKETETINTAKEVGIIVRRIAEYVTRAKWTAVERSPAVNPTRLDFMYDDMAEWLIKNAEPNFDLPAQKPELDSTPRE